MTRQILIVVLVLELFCLESSLYGQVVLDGTVGPWGELTGPNYEISSGLGSQRGTNLFHSFETFSLSSNESAHFSGPDTISTIISRITGRDRSIIDGRIISSIPGADFFLINPNGLVFGPNAALDINGSFFGSTADTLIFEDKSEYSATTPQQSTLSTAAPQAFGFLDPDPTAISVVGKLSGRSSTTMSLVGGTMEISGRIEIPGGGRICLSSVGSAGETDLGGISTDNFTLLSDISLKDKSGLITSGPNPGSIYIRAGNLYMENTVVGMYNTGLTDDDGIDINVRNHIEMKGGELKTYATENGNGGDILMASQSMLFTGEAEVVVNNYGPSSSGNIEISSEDLILEKGSILGSYISGSGISGDIDADSGNIQLKEGSSILTITGGESDGGKVKVATSVLDISGASQIGTIANEGGSAGNIHVETGHSIEISGKNDQNIKSGLFSQTSGSGSSGFIRVDAPEIRISDHGQIYGTRNSDAGFLQDIQLMAETLWLESSGIIVGGSMDIATGQLIIEEGAYIWGRPVFTGTSCLLDIRAEETIDIFGMGEDLEQWRNTDHPLYTGIHTDIFIDRTGNAGDIFISAPVIRLENSGQIGARTYTDGSGGNIFVQSDNLWLESGGQIGVDSFGSTLFNGSAGNIFVTAQESIHISGEIGELPSGFVSRSRSEGNSGLIALTSPLLTIDDDATIAVNTGLLSYGDAGRISIEVDRLKLLNQGSVSSSAGGTGAEGHIKISADQEIYMDKGVISSLCTYSGSAGDIVLRTPLMTMYNGWVTSETRNYNKGGDIDIHAGDLFLFDDSLITSSSSDTGDAGTISIQAPGSIRFRESRVVTETLMADGGDISLSANQVFHMVDSEITTSVKDEVGNGGNITIDPIFIILERSDIRANAYQGSGGNISLTTDYFFTDTGSTIEASSDLGIDGVITIDTPNIDLSASFASLPEYNEIVELSKDDCESKGNKGASSLVKKGQGGLPKDPLSPLTAGVLEP